MREMTIDANSLMQYLFLLHAKYGKGSSDASRISPGTTSLTSTKPPPSLSVSQPPKSKQTRKRQSSVQKANASKSKISKAAQVPVEKVPAATVVTNKQNHKSTVQHQVSQPISETIDQLIEPVSNNLPKEALSNENLPENLQNTIPHSIPDTIASDIVVSSEAEPTLTAATIDTNEKSNEPAVLPPLRMLKLSLNSKTGNLRICEMPEDCGSLLDNRLTFPPEVGLWKNNHPPDIQQSILDLSDIIRRDAENAVNKTCTSNTENSETQIPNDTTNIIQSDKNIIPDTSALVDNPCAEDGPITSSENHQVSTVSFAAPESDTQAESEWNAEIETGQIFDLSPTKEAMALQRSRRKSKPQKCVSLDDSLTFSDDDLDSFNLEDFDADWLDLDIDEIETTMVSPKRDSISGKHLSMGNFGKEDRIYQCLHCDVRLPTADRLERHVQHSHQLTSFKCPGCRRSFATQYRLDCHLSLNCPGVHNKTHICDHCGLKFDTIEDRDIHTSENCSKDIKKPFKCKNCDFKSGVGKEVEKHVDIVHAKVKKFHCVLCDFKTAWKKSLHMHIVKHDGTKPYSCTLCKFTCNDQYNLNHHIKTHTTRTNEMCNVCGTKFRLKRHLIAHKRIHNRDKLNLYKCDDCNYTTSSLPNFCSHKSVHLTEKKHACSDCDKTFSRPNLLKVHVAKMHTDERDPFSCVSCEYIGTSKQGLNSHMRKHSKYKNPTGEIRSSQRRSEKAKKLNDTDAKERKTITKCHDKITANLTESFVPGSGKVSDNIIADESMESDLNQTGEITTKLNESNFKSNTYDSSEMKIGSTPISQKGKVVQFGPNQSGIESDERVKFGHSSNTDEDSAGFKFGQARKSGGLKISRSKSKGKRKGKLGKILELGNKSSGSPFDTLNMLNKLASGTSSDDNQDFLAQDLAQDLTHDSSTDPENLDLQILMNLVKH